MPFRRVLIALLAMASVTAVAPAAPTPSRALPDLDRIDPVRYPLADAVIERALIKARDGITMLAVDIIRPRTSRRVPTIFFQSPYYNTNGRGFRAERKLPWGLAVPPNVGSVPRVAFPEWYDEYFVPRGYAVVMQDQRGTRNSSGCQVYGGREEITDAVDVIHWIGRQPWSNRAVGMTGGSYDGTIAVGAASMAPEELKAIIPIRAIDRWYDYHFFNGVQSAEHQATPFAFTTLNPMTDQASSVEEDQLYPLHVLERKACAATFGAFVSTLYSSPYQDARGGFWASRDYLKDARNITAATFIIHGLNDTNVKTTNAGQLWERLPAGTPKKLWWLRGGHDDPANPNLDFQGVRVGVAAAFREWTHRWFAQYLKGVDAGAEQAPPVTVQDERGVLWNAPTWPPPAGDARLYLGREALRSDPDQGTLTYLDGVSGLAFPGAPLTAAMRIAGRPYLRLAYTLPAGGDTTFAVSVVHSGLGREIAYGYARGAYRSQIRARAASWPSLPAPHLPGEEATIYIPMAYTDYLLPRGASLTVLLRSDDGRVLGTGTGGQISVDLAESYLVLPVARDRRSEQLRAG